MEPPAIAPSLVDAAHVGASADIEPRCGLEKVGSNGRRIASGDGAATHMKTSSPMTDLPALVAEIEADVQSVARGRILAPQDCLTGSFPCSLKNGDWENRL
jgi:hypothetical protein